MNVNGKNVSFITLCLVSNVFVRTALSVLGEFNNCGRWGEAL